MIHINSTSLTILNYILNIPLAYAQVTSKVGSTADDVGSQTGSELTKLIANIFTQIPLWIAAIIVTFGSYLIAIAVRRAIEMKLSKEGLEEEHREVQIVAGRSAFFITLVLGITIALSIVGIDLKPIVAAGAFGLGFALQDIIMNLISGMMILASRHYTIGDVIVVNGVSGKIEEIQTRATIIKAFDGTKIIVPNADLFSNIVVSKTSNPTRRLEFVMGCGYEDDLKEVVRLTKATIKDIPGILPKPAPKVIFYEWADSEVLFKIKVWVDSRGGKMTKVKNAVIMKLTKAYNDSNFEMPYPIQTVELTSLYNPPARIDTSTQKHKKNSKARLGHLKEFYENMAVSPINPLNKISDPVSPSQPLSTINAPANIDLTEPINSMNSNGQAWLQQTFKETVDRLNPPIALESTISSPPSSIAGNAPPLSPNTLVDTSAPTLVVPTLVNDPSITRPPATVVVPEAPIASSSSN